MAELGYIVIIMLGIFVLLCIMELFAAQREENVRNNGRRRYFILREYAVGRNRIIRTNQDYPLYVCVKGTAMENIQIPFFIDQKGFIEPSEIYENADINIAFVGDSTTECALVAPEFRFPYLVGRMLQEAKGVTVNSYNAGYSSASSVFILATVLYKVLPLKPRAIVWQSNISDIIALMNVRDWSDVVRSKSNDIFWTANALTVNILRRAKYVVGILFPNLYSALGERKEKGRQNKTGLEKSKTVPKKINKEEIKKLEELILSNLKIFVEICRSNHILPVVSTQAILWSRGGNASERDMQIFSNIIESRIHISFDDFLILFEEVNNVTRQYCAEARIPLVDLEREIPKDSKYIYDYVHYTNEGSQKVAECFYSVLKDLELNTE